jgi:hypothetical protein
VRKSRGVTRVAVAPCLAVVYTFLPIKVLSLVFRGVISSLPPPLLHRKVYNGFSFFVFFRKPTGIVLDTGIEN